MFLILCLRAWKEGLDDEKVSNRFGSFIMVLLRVKKQLSARLPCLINI